MNGDVGYPSPPGPRRGRDRNRRPPEDSTGNAEGKRGVRPLFLLRHFGFSLGEGDGKDESFLCVPVPAAVYPALGTDAKRCAGKCGGTLLPCGPVDPCPVYHRRPGVREGG